MATIVKEYFDRVRSFNIGVFFKVGSYMENNKNNGITHLIEHMVFKRTFKRTSLQISKEIERVGGSIDAYTSKEVVGFFARVDNSFKNIALDILSDVVLNPNFSEEDLLKEREVVCEELKMRKDNPLSLAFENFEKIMFKPSPYSFEVGGNIENVRSMTIEDLKQFYEDNFIDQNAVISITGKFDDRTLNSEINEYFKFKAGKESLYPTKIDRSEQKNILITKDVQQANFIIGFRSVSIKEELYYPLRVLMNAIAGEMSSILFQKLREEEGLVYVIGNGSDNYYGGGYEAVYASTSPEKYLRAIEKILRVFKDIKDGKISEDHIKDSKSNIIGSLSLSLESPLAYLSKNAKDIIFHKRIRSIDEIIENIQNARLNFNEISKLIVPDNIYISTIGPKGIEKYNDKVRGMINEILS